MRSVPYGSASPRTRLIRLLRFILEARSPLETRGDTAPLFRPEELSATLLQREIELHVLFRRMSIMTHGLSVLKKLLLASRLQDVATAAMLVIGTMSAPDPQENR